MPLGTELDLDLRDIAFDVDPATPRKKGHTQPHPVFGPCLLWPNGWMDEDAAWYGSRPRPRPHCTRRGSQLPQKGYSSPPPVFSAHVYCGHGRPSQLLLSSCYMYGSAGNRFIVNESRLIMSPDILHRSCRSVSPSVCPSVRTIARRNCVEMRS